MFLNIVVDELVDVFTVVELREHIIVFIFEDVRILYLNMRFYSFLVNPVSIGGFVYRYGYGYRPVLIKLKPLLHHSFSEGFLSHKQPALMIFYRPSNDLRSTGAVYIYENCQWHIHRI